MPHCFLLNVMLLAFVSEPYPEGTPWCIECRSMGARQTTIARAVCVAVKVAVAKRGQRFEQLKAVLCARKTLVNYWFIVSC
jgi:hypothetical protein